MNTLLRLPAAASAVSSALCALLPVAGDAVVALGAGTLAWLSVGRPRRVLWAAAAAIALAHILPLAVLAQGVALRLPDPLAETRGSLQAPLERLLPQPDASLAVGIVLGERGAIPRELREAFQDTGTSHLLAISGYNLTLVGAAVAMLVRGRTGPRGTALISLAAIAAYALVVGPQPSVARASLMAAIATLGLVLGRRGLGLNALLAAAAAMLAIEPLALHDVGFQLSVSATAGLLLLQRPIADRLPLPGPLRDGLGATLAATLLTLPVIAATFGRLSLVSPLANLAAVPLFAPLLVIGMLASLVGAVALDAARPFALLALVATRALRAVVELAASVPLASIAVADGAIGALLATIAAVAILRGWRRNGMEGGVSREASHLARHGPTAVIERMWMACRARRVPTEATRRPARERSEATRRPALLDTSGHRATVATAVVAIVIGAASGAAIAAPGDVVRVRALDVGQGDAFFVECAGRYAVVDGGPDGNRLAAQIGATLPPWHRRIDLVALTHAHADHAAGLFALIGRHEIGLALEPLGMSGPIAETWADALARAGVERRAVGAGTRLRFGACEIAVLAPSNDPAVDLPNLVLRVERGDFSLLFTGDATDRALADLLLEPEALRSRVYVPPHHGAASPHGPALVAAVRPEVALLSVGASNRYGHPTPETLSALGAIPVYRTDRDGTVEIAADGPRIAVRTRATGLPPSRGGPIPRAPASR